MRNLMLQLEDLVTPSHLDVLSTRVRWFVQMRWVFITFVLLASFVLSYFFSVVSLQVFFILAAILTVLNISYVIAGKKMGKKTPSATQIYVFGTVQLICDYIILSLFLYYSGGVSNPMIYMFIFHVIISCLLLPNMLAFAIVFGAIGFFLTLATLSQFGVILYYPFPLVLHEIMMTRPCTNCFLFDAGCFVFTVTLVFYFVANITVLLRKREELLRDAINDMKKMGDVRMKTMMHVAHDLKAPLAAAQSSIKTVEDGYAGPIGEKAHSILTNAYRRCQNMTAMVKDMFDLIRFDEQILRGELTAEEFSLNDLINGVKEQFVSAYSGRSIEWDIKVDEPIKIYANIRQMEALLSNLVSNAIKYSRDPANVIIFAKKSGANLILSVSDGGIGISAEEKGKVLEEFYRTVAAKKIEKDGVGLGLSIVQKIVKFYNGKITIEDGPNNKGTTFTILLSDVIGTREPKEIEKKW